MQEGKQRTKCGKKGHHRVAKRLIDIERKQFNLIGLRQNSKQKTSGKMERNQGWTCPGMKGEAGGSREREKQEKNIESNEKTNKKTKTNFGGLIILCMRHEMKFKEGTRKINKSSNASSFRNGTVQSKRQGRMRGSGGEGMSVAARTEGAEPTRALAADAIFAFASAPAPAAAPIPLNGPDLATPPDPGCAGKDAAAGEGNGTLPSLSGVS